jgi:hypothetical protein
VILLWMHMSVMVVVVSQELAVMSDIALGGTKRRGRYLCFALL